MGETDGDPQPAGETQSSPGPDERPSPGPGQESLQVPAGKRRRIKSPTPGSIRGRSMTPVRGRSQTPFSQYLTRRSATPSTWRSITPFLKREDKEKTPFELGTNIKTQLDCNKAVFDKALIMDITEPEVAPVRYITTDLSVIDRAAVMDISNVEVIYVVEEYEEYEEYTEEEELKEDEEKADDEKKKKGKKSKKKEVKPKKKAEKKEKSPSPKLSLKLEIGGGPKVSKKMFDQPPPPPPEKAKPPPAKKAKSKLALQMEEQAKAAAKAAEEEAKKAQDKPKKETFEERQKRLKEEKEAEEEARRAEEEARRAEEEEEEGGEEDGEGEGDGEGDGEDEAGTDDEAGDGENEDGGEDGEHDEGERDEEDATSTRPGSQMKMNDDRRGSGSSGGSFVKIDPEEEARWQKIAEEEGEEFMQKMRKVSQAKSKSEKERHADWQKNREAARMPSFINFLTDRTAEEGHSVRLACAVSGPELSIKWFKDGRQIERDARHRISDNNNILSLELVNTVSSDSGEYSCVISNMNDDVTSSCIVTIYEVFKDEPSPPAFSVIRDFYHLHDDELTIECHAHGTPRPRVTWIKDAVAIKPSYKYTILEEAHGVYKLMIYRPSNRDSGKYICKAENKSGELEITHNVEFVKQKKFHVHGIFHAHDELQKQKGETAKRAMEEAMKSKEDYDKKRGGGERRVRGAVDEPPVAPKNKLKYASQLRDRIAVEGAKVKLVCNVIGPDPSIKWLKDDKPLVWGPKVRNLSSENMATIELTDVTSEHSGVYKCIAVNQFNEIDTSCYLKVYTAQSEGDEQEPMFALPMRDVYHSSENDLVIDTKVRGNPRPKISWLKDEMPVESDARIQQIEHLDGICELIINKPTPKDSGNYTCVADNSLGSQKIAHTVVVEVLPSSRRSSASTSMGVPEDKDSQASKPKREGGGPDQPGKPPAKGKKKAPEAEAPEEGGRRRHAIPDVSPKDKLYFIANMSNRYLAEGARVKMSAVIGGPDPQLKWLKNDGPVAYGPRIKNLSREGLAVLEISNAIPDDSGIYTCIARNEANEISTQALLHIYQPKVNADLEPMFTRALKDTYHLNTNELILETHVRGQPTPTVTWIKDSVELQNGEKFQQIDHPDGTCELIIDKPGNNDTGKYICRAESSAGKADITHFVLFEGKASHIAENIHGVFHADPLLLKKGKASKEADGEVTEVKPAEEEEEGKGKGKGKGKGGKGAKAAEEPAPDKDAKPAKEEKREKRVGVNFAAKLSDRVVAEGSKVKLTCYVEGTEPQVKWLKDDQNVQYGPKVRQNYREGLCTLELLSASESDSGQYKCYARDNNGETTTICKVTVYTSPGSSDVPPTFTRSIKDTYHGKINELVLDCHVRGLPTPTVTWVKDGVRIEPSEKYQQIDHDDGTCELFINDPIPYDSGKYTCQAENRAGKSDIVHIVHFEAKDMRQGSPAREVGRKEEKPAEAAVAEAEAPKQAENKDEPKDDKKDAKKKEKKKGAEESSGGGRRSPPPPPDPKKNLFFGNYLNNRTVQEGSTVRMTIYIEGPEPQVRWYKDDQVLVYGPKTKSACQDGIATLILCNSEITDSGEYKLVARNPDSEITTTCRINVYKKIKEDEVSPVFTVGIKDTYYLNEHELVLDCRVRGTPRPEISWMKDNDMIINDDKYQQLDQADGYCKLVISNPSEKDSGVYTCRAQNTVNAEKITHTVEFEGRERFILEKAHGFFHRNPNKPHFTNTLGNHIVTAGGTIAIQAEFGQTTSPVEVQWLKDKAMISAQPNIRTFADHGVYTLAIEKATPEYTGTYTCRASNAFGRIESNANVHIIGPTIKGGKPALFLSRPETEMKIAVHDPFSLSFRVQGEPKPKLILMKGTKDITKSDRVSKEAQEDYIRFTIQKSTISDSGTYFVVARNEHGTDRLFVTISVMPRARSVTPTMPRWGQPLESYPQISHFKNPPGHIPSEPIVVDVGKNHISLAWAKPHTNDSAPVLAYRVDSWMVGKDGGAVWKSLGMTPINGYDAFNLKSGSEYHFRVTPRNRYGWGESTQTSSPILIGGTQLLPEFTKILPGQRKALINNECILECVVRGSPKPLVVWYKDGHPIESTDRVSIRLLGSTCKLRISQVFEVDSGRYTCEATNNQGKVSTFARLQVVSDPRIFEADTNLKKFITGDMQPLDEMLPQFTMRLRDRRVQVTYPVRLTCQVVGLPEPEVTWSKDGSKIENSERWLVCDDGQFSTLEIGTTCLDDSGTYTATARNEHGSVSCHCSLTVDKGIRAYIAPEFYVPLDPVYTFDEGTELRLSAQVEAYPTVGVAWLRNGIRIRPSRRILGNLDHDGFVELVIANANQRDAGIYSCIASNAVGRAESSCRVAIDISKAEEKKPIPIVKGPNLPYSKEPMFVMKPRSSEAFEGDTVIIQCEVIGDPKPEVVWLRDFLKPEYYKDAPHFRRIGDGPEYRLQIPRAKLDFTGTYSVIATNCHGEVKAIISLQIYAKDMSKTGSMEKGSIIHGNVETLPSITRHLKDLRCCDGDSITLECHVEGVPEPIIIWEKDGRLLSSSEKDFVTAYNGTQATLSIRRVYPEDEGEYTCVASNNIGRAYSSACIIVDVPEEKENLLSRQLARPPGLLSAQSTPRSTPRSTPIRSISPLTLSYRNTSIDLTPRRRKFAAPKFFSIPHNKLVEEGETVRFQCAITGHPLPWSTWDKDGTVVTPTARISVKERDDLRFLDIEQVTYDDAGLYRITLENDYGRVEATARLDVIGGRRSSSRSVRTYSSSPRRNIYISRGLMGNSTRIGGRLALSCTLRGSSVPARKFYHNGEEVVESSRVSVQLTDTDATLIVNNVVEDDQGDYTCIAENDFGLVATSTFVSFYRPDSEILANPPEIKKLLSPETKVCEGQTVDLVFEIKSAEPYLYLWSKDDETLMNSDEFLYIDHGNGCIGLRVMDPFDMDSGLYTCTVTSANGSCQTSTQLVVEEDRASANNSDLEIVKNPLPALGFQGDIISFSTKVRPSKAHAVWTVCGRDIEQDSREFSLESQTGGVRILHILGVEHKHSGEIKVTVTHPLTKACLRSYTELAVLPSLGRPIFDFDDNSNGEVPDIPAYITKAPDDCTGLIGGTIILETTFNGVPTPCVEWFKAGRPIAESSNIRISIKSTRSTLVLTGITGDDSGKYTVEVMNEYGSDFAAASVAVEGPPEPPSGRPSVSQGPDRVAVAWCGPPYDGGCMITGFILEMEQENCEWTEVATVLDSLAYTIKDLKSDCIYKFRVRAENIHGRSEPSLPSDPVIVSSSSLTITEENGQTIKIASGGDFKSRFELIEELGKGRFGIVYKVLEKESQQIMAAKIIKCIKARDRAKVQEEISIMKSLHHPKLLQLAADFDNPREIVMVMEFITGGELFERVVADDFTLTEHDCIIFLRQICEGVNYMHSKEIVHLDLKPENIMCHTRTSHQIKIIDFGLAQRLSANTSVRVLFGTPEFIAPEIINYEPIGFQTDMWSIGVICYVLLSGLSPFMGDTDVDTFANITRADYDFDDEAFDAVSEEAEDFISSLLIHRKENRLTAKECLDSKWLSQDNESNLSNVKICTDKLKKFIIRRKWQKTGNAIRALGRMATLSASRRNSAASGSLPNSPRPSISAGSGFSTSLLPGRMSSLNEENDDFDTTLDKKLAPTVSAIKGRDKVLCNERSDSGFSECSSCSGGSHVPCLHPHPLFDKVPAISEELESNILTNAVAHDILKLKLEEIAKTQQLEEEEAHLKSFSKKETRNNSTDSCSSLKNFSIEVPRDALRKTSTAVDFNKGPIMQSDFTNTIKMRKKSLENSAVREKIAPKTPFESHGKVSKLKKNFTAQETPPKSTIVSSIALGNKTNPESMDWKTAKPKNVFERLTSNSKTNTVRLGQSSSVPASPTPLRATMRLGFSGRFKDTTAEKLSTTPRNIRSTRSMLEQSTRNQTIKSSTAPITATTIQKTDRDNKQKTSEMGRS